MQRSIQQKKRFNWFVKLTGASSEILEKCSETCRNTFSYAGMTLLFTTFTSAGIVAFAVSTYSFKDQRSFPVIFLVWSLFIYLFDRLVILADSPITKWVRIWAILILAVFYSFIWDTITLRDDIQSQLKQEYNDKVSVVDNSYDKTIISLQTRINDFQNKNEGINLKKQAYIDSLQAEGKGTGGSHKYGIATVYKNLEALKNQFNTVADSNIKFNNSVIAEVENKIKSINADREIKERAIVKPSETGLMAQVRVMHQIVFVKGTSTEIIFFFLWFSIFCLLESLPVLVKVVFKERIREYIKCENVDQENCEKTFEIRNLNDWTVLEAELQFDLQTDLLRFTSNSFLKKVELDKQDICHRLYLLEEFLGELEKIDLKLKSLYPGKYNEYIKPEIDQAADDFAKSMDHNS